MITSIRVENFRGIEKLEVKDFGRINLIIGRNNSGKTALLEALMLGANPEQAGQYVMLFQHDRMTGTPQGSADINPGDFDGFWRPIFRGGRAEQGLSIFLLHDSGKTTSLKMSKSSAVLPTKAIVYKGAVTRMVPWVLEYTVERPEGSGHFEVRGGPEGVSFAPGSEAPESDREPFWISSKMSEELFSLGILSRLKQQSRDRVINELLQQFDERIKGVEILSPTGIKAALFFRLSEGNLMLPLRLMGDGVQRYMEYATTITGTNWPFVVIDEVENGLHHSVLEPMWTWIAEISRQRGLQIFATTHSEECMHAAANAFKELDDDGLRVIRLDRREHETGAAVYDKELVLSAERTGVEIRG